MLQPNKDRLDYGNLLMPPEGFQLDNAIATSYSLDLDALISIPVALYFAHSLDLNVNQDVVQILDSIRRASDTVKVFCQKGQIKVPDNLHRLYSFIEPCVVQIPPTRKDSFHPKIWVIRYKNKTKEIKYRVIILSRNLTFDRSGDVAFNMDGNCIQERQNNFKKTKPLVDFINHLAGYEEISWLKTFVADLGKTEFKITANEFEDFNFLPTGFQGYQKNILFDKQIYDELLIISPFITNGGLDLARKHSINKPYLFSREFELKKINQEVLKHFSVFHLTTDFVEGEEKLEADTEENIPPQLQDLHAKVYSYKEGWNAYLLLGSSNCSMRAMVNNVEFMIQLKGKNSKIGPEAIFKELLNDELKVFQKYSATEQLSEQEQLLTQEEQELQNLKIDLVNSILIAKAIKQEDSNFKIEVDFNLKSIPNNPKIRTTAYLLRSNEQKQIIKTGERNIWTVHNISELDLSCFLIIELKLEGSSAAISFAMKIQIENLPDTRNTKVFRDIISNTANFFKYIRFLLAENYWDEQLSFGDDFGKDSDGNPFGIYFNQEEPIYENLLKAISRDPEKLEEIKKVMDKLSEEENKDQPIIPEDFKKLWNVFEETR
jgi:HKD family nuclease